MDNTSNSQNIRLNMSGKRESSSKHNDESNKGNDSVNGNTTVTPDVVPDTQTLDHHLQLQPQPQTHTQNLVSGQDTTWSYYSSLENLQLAESAMRVGTLSLFPSEEFINQECAPPKSSINWNGNISDYSGWEEFKEEMFFRTCSQVWSLKSSPELSNSSGSGSCGEFSDVNQFHGSINERSVSNPTSNGFSNASNSFQSMSSAENGMEYTDACFQYPSLQQNPTSDYSNGVLVTANGNSGRKVSSSAMDNEINEVDQIIRDFEDNHNIRNTPAPVPQTTQHLGQESHSLNSDLKMQPSHESLAVDEFPVFKGQVRSPKEKSTQRNGNSKKVMYTNNKRLPFLKIKETDVSCLGVKLDYGNYVGDSIRELKVGVQYLQNTYSNAETEHDNETRCVLQLDKTRSEYENLYPYYYRHKYTRNLWLLLESVENIVYYKSQAFGVDQPYEPEYYRIETDQNGNQRSETLSGCCAYCKVVKFLPFKNSSYLSHMALEHGIYSSGYLTPDWRNLGKYKRLDANTGMETTMDAVQCAQCSQLIDTSGWSSKKNKMLGYFRHFKLKHSSLTTDKRCALQYPPIKLRGRTSYSGSGPNST